MNQLAIGRRASESSHPSGFDQLPPEFFGGVVEGEFLTAQVVDWRVALQVEEQVVVETHFFWLLLKKDVTKKNVLM